jgi:hypothetical protein
VLEVVAAEEVIGNADLLEAAAVDCVGKYRSISEVVLVWITLEDAVGLGRFLVYIGLGRCSLL